MKKNKIKDKEEKLVLSGTNPETGEAIVFSEEEQRTLLLAEHRIKISTLELALAFKIIKDNQLYMMRACENFKEYVEGIGLYSYSYVLSLVSVGDAFSDSKNITALESVGIRKLIEIKKAGDRKIIEEIKTEEDEEKIQLLIKTKLDSLKEKNKQLNEKLNSEKAHRENHRQTIQELESDFRKSEEENRRVLDAIARDKNIDSRKYESILNKDEAIEKIMFITKEINNLQALISEIPDKLRDEQMTGMVETACNNLQYAAENIRVNWVSDLTDSSYEQDQELVP